MNNLTTFEIETEVKTNFIALVKNASTNIATRFNIHNLDFENTVVELRKVDNEAIKDFALLITENVKLIESHIELLEHEPLKQFKKLVSYYQDQFNLVANLDLGDDLYEFYLAFIPNILMDLKNYINEWMQYKKKKLLEGQTTQTKEVANLAASLCFIP